MPSAIPPETIIEDLQRVAKILGHTPLVTEYERLGAINPITARHRFGTWKAVLKAANLEPTSEHRNFWTDEDLENELKRLERELGHKPSYREVKEFSIVSPDTFMRRMGQDNFTDPTETNSAEWNLDTISVEDGMWIAGFTNGDGCFTVRIGSVCFSISQRSDSIDVIQFVANILGVPDRVYVSSNKSRRAKGQKVGDECHLSVNNRWLLKKHIIPFFNRFPLKGRKANDFKIFETAVLFLCDRDTNGRHRKRFTPSEFSYLKELTDSLKSLRYDPTAWID